MFAMQALKPLYEAGDKIPSLLSSLSVAHRMLFTLGRLTRSRSAFRTRSLKELRRPVLMSLSVTILSVARYGATSRYMSWYGRRTAGQVSR